MYVAANQVYATASEAKTVYKGPAATAKVMDTIEANKKVQVRGVVYRNNGTT